MKSPLTVRLRLTVAWQTLRYSRSLETLNPDMTVKSEVSTYGRCQKIPNDVPQKEN